MPTTLAPRELEVPKELEEAWNRFPSIVKLGHPVLRQVAKPVLRFGSDTQRLVERMSVVIKEAHGLGLAAPQVGVSTRVIIYDLHDDHGVHVIINPKIISMRGEQLEPMEGCLSIPGLQGTVVRALEIRVRGYDERGKPISRRVTDMEARVIQHEVDHLDGILFIDKADPETLEWAIGPHDEE